jgi:hypothetical protein
MPSVNRAIPELVHECQRLQEAVQAVQALEVVTVARLAATVCWETDECPTLAIAGALDECLYQLQRALDSLPHQAEKAA